MARLTIEQVQAPDLSVSAQLLRGANESFNSGLESAKGLLAKYDEGQKAKNDALILNDIAKLDSEDALNAYLKSDALVGLNLSENMQKTVLGLRSGVLGYAQDRAATTSVVDSNSRANAAEGRTAAEDLDRINARTERRGMTGAVVDNAIEGRRYGQGGSTGGSTGISADNPVFSDFMGTVQKAGVTNPYALAAIAATGSHESGFSSKNATGSWSDPSESGRPGTAGGIMSWNNERFDAMKAYTNGDLSGAAQAAYFLNEDPELIAKLQAANSPEEAATLMNNAWRFAGYDRPGGEAGARIETTRGLVGMFSDGAALPITQNAPGSGPANDALIGAIKNSLYLEPDQALSLLQTGYDAQKEGQALIDAAENRRQAEAVAAAQLAAIQDPNNSTAADLQRAGLNIPGVSAANRLAAGAQGGELAGTFAGVLAPPVTANPLVTQSNDAQTAEEARNTSVDPVITAFENAKAFDGAEDIGSAVTGKLGLPNEGITSSANVNKEMARFGKVAGLTPGEVGAVYASLAENGISMEDMLTATSDSPIYQAMQDRAAELFSPEARIAAEDRAASDLASKTSRDAIQGEILKAKTYAAKLPAGSSDRAEATKRVKLLEAASIAANQPEKTRAATEKYLGQPVSGATSEEIKAFEAAIKNDESLDDEQKTLLILGLRL